MFHKFDHYGNINCVFTSVYASLSNKYKVIDSLATNINYQLKRNKKDQPVDYFDGSVLMAVASLSLYFDGFSVRTNFPKSSYWRTRR